MYTLLLVIPCKKETFSAIKLVCNAGYKNDGLKIIAKLIEHTALSQSSKWLCWYYWFLLNWHANERPSINYIHNFMSNCSNEHIFYSSFELDSVKLAYQIFLKSISIFIENFHLNIQFARDLYLKIRLVALNDFLWYSCLLTGDEIQILLRYSKRQESTKWFDLQSWKGIWMNYFFVLSHISNNNSNIYDANIMSILDPFNPSF